MEINGLIKRIAVNTTSQIIAKGATVVLGFLTIGLLTRYLGVAQYGIYNLVFAYLASYGIFADFGLRLTLVRDLSGEQERTELKSTYFALQITLILLSTFLALVFLLLFPYSPLIKMTIIVGSLGVGVGYMNGYGASVLQSKMKLDTAALLEIINRVVTVGTIALFVWLQWNIYAIISTILIGNIVTLVINIYITPEFFRLKHFPPFALLSAIIKSSFPVGITSLLAVLYFKIDLMMLSVMKTTVDVGIYSLSYKIFDNIIMLWLFYLASIYPLMSHSVKEKARSKINKLIRGSIIIALAFSVITIVISWVAAPLAINILGGKNFFASISPFRILLFALPFVFINDVQYYLLLSLSKIRSIVFTLVSALVFNFIVNLLIIPKYGYLGTSVSTVVTEIIILIGYSIALKKYNSLV
jgi:O-antigen/teichoic acid export membrane protein